MVLKTKITDPIVPSTSKPQGQKAMAAPSKALTRPNIKTTFGVPKKQK